MQSLINPKQLFYIVILTRCLKIFKFNVKYLRGEALCFINQKKLLLLKKMLILATSTSSHCYNFSSFHSSLTYLHHLFLLRSQLPLPTLFLPTTTASFYDYNFPYLTSPYPLYNSNIILSKILCPFINCKKLILLMLMSRFIYFILSLGEEFLEIYKKLLPFVYIKVRVKHLILIK